MKRGLKENSVALRTNYLHRVPETSPMKRGLKALPPRSPPQTPRGSRDFPDEEGTERLDVEEPQDAEEAFQRLPR